MSRKKNRKQYHFARKTFSYNQFWISYYTEVYEDESQQDFATFIKAKSSRLAKSILIKKSKEDNPSVKIKSARIYMLHKDFVRKSSKRRLDISDWSDVQNCHFPNLNNYLFKYPLERKKGYDYRGGKTNLDHLKTIGFKKGQPNYSTLHRKGNHLPLTERKGKVWNGDRWIEWDKSEMEHAKSKIIDALILNNNNRTKAAKSVKMSKHKFYHLMHRCDTREWWNENYPAPKLIPPKVSTKQRSQTQKKVMLKRKLEGKLKLPNHSPQLEQKRLQSLRAYHESISDEHNEMIIPKIKKALSENYNVRTLAAKSLGVKHTTFRKWIQKTKHLVNWLEEYPSQYNSHRSQLCKLIK
jgi:transposase